MREKISGWEATSRSIHVLRALAWALVLFIAYATLTPIELRPTGPVQMSVALERMAAYFVLSAAFALAYPKLWWAGIVAALACAAPLEIVQNLLPDRHGRLEDFVVKLAGGAAGAICAVAIMQVARFKARFTAAAPESPPDRYSQP
jgi:hypothetical protein